MSSLGLLGVRSWGASRREESKPQGQSSGRGGQVGDTGLDAKMAQRE